MQNPLKLTISGAGIAVAKVPNIGVASLCVLMAVAGSVAVDVSVYLVSSLTAPTGTTGANQIAHLKGPASDSRILDLLGGSSGIAIGGQNNWLLASFADSDPAHELWAYYEQV